jgi:hypothetical protein
MNKDQLLSRLSHPDSRLVLTVMDMLSKFVLRPEDDIEATVTASKDDVKIMFRIVKRPTPPSGSDQND